MDLKDAHAELLPTLLLITRYYITRATQTDLEGRRGSFNVNLLMTEWNPYLALLKIKSYGILVDIAKTSHERKIVENTAGIAKLFYGISMLEKSIRAHKEIVALGQKKVGYGRSRNEQGTIDPLQLRTWENSVRGDQIQLETLKNELDEKTGQLKMLLGFPPDHHLPLDTRDAVNQILAGFNGEVVTFAEIQASNLELNILAKKEQLHSNFVTGSYVALLPRPVVLFEDVQNQVDRTSGFNFALGLDYTLWDGFKRVREIRRQKLKLQKTDAERRLLSQRLYSTFTNLRRGLGLAGESEAQSQEQAKLAELSEERSYMGYKSGELPYEQYLEARMRKVVAQLAAARSGQDRVISLIELATIAGGLDKYNAGIRY
jgi:outer membrane protein TolC